VLGALLLQAGCADLNRTRPETAEEILSRHRTTVAAGEPAAEAKLDGFQLEVQAHQRCNLVEMQEVERTTVYEEDMDDGDTVLYGTLAGVGAVPLGVGIALLADAPNVYGSDPNSRQYNYLGPEYPIIFGAILGAIGATMVTISTVNGIRALGTDEETTITTRTGPVLQRNVPCEDGGPAVGRTVSARWPGGSAAVGSTDQQGRLSVDLTRVLPLQLFQRPEPPAVLELWMGQQRLGEIEATELGRAVLRFHDDRAWEAAKPAACAQAQTAPACAGVQLYLQTFPQGLHAAEAERLLAFLTGKPLQVAGHSEDPRLQQSIAEAKQAASEVTERLRQQAEQRAKTEARNACRAACRRACQRDASCRSACAKEACP
jgi:hypothetical protein